MGSAFSEHFLNKYFAYREGYVAYIHSVAPEREKLAVLAEILRLTFVASGSVFCSLLFWLLTVAAFGRGPAAGVWVLVFGLCAVCGSWFALLALRGLGRALGERRRFARRGAR